MHKKITVLLALVLIGLFVFAGYSNFNTIQITPNSEDTAYNIDSYNTSGTRTFYVDSSGNAVSSATVTATAFVNSNGFERTFALPLAGAAVLAGNDIDDGTVPLMSSVDNVPAIVWATSGETTHVQWTFRLPTDFSSGLKIYALVSSSDSSGTGTILDWSFTVNKDDTGFGSATGQDSAECTSNSLAVSNEVLTLTSTAETLYSAGSWITLDLFNASTDNANLELKGVEVAYTSTH